MFDTHVHLPIFIEKLFSKNCSFRNHTLSDNQFGQKILHFVPYYHLSLWVSYAVYIIIVLKEEILQGSNFLTIGKIENNSLNFCVIIPQFLKHVI